MKRYLLKAVFLLALMTQAASAYAGPPDPPAWLVNAVVAHESSWNPLALNINKESFYPETEDEARALLESALERGVSVDIGLGQINIQHIKRAGIPPESLFDPALNLQWCRKLLADVIQRHGFNWYAVGHYHSPKKELGRLYAWRIFQEARKQRGQ